MKITKRSKYIGALSCMTSSLLVAYFILEKISIKDVGHIPKELYQTSPPTTPTVVFTVGLSGSGKSTWADDATKYGWAKVDSDELTFNAVKAMRLNNEISPLLGHVPNEMNSENLFALRDMGYRKTEALVNTYLKKKKSFIFDSLGFNWIRLPIERKAKEMGFDVWYLVFQSSDLRINRYYLLLRESKGGFASGTTRPLQEKCEFLLRMLEGQKKHLQDFLDKIEDKELVKADKIFFTLIEDLREKNLIVDSCTPFD